MTTTVDDLVERYLRRLRAALRVLPREQRREIIQEIEGHIAEARSGLDDESEAAIRTTLDRLGEPEEIVAEARERHGVEKRSVGALEVWALILLLIGGVVLPVFGWIVGVALLWSSRLWTTGDRFIGTFVPPGGLMAAAAMFFLSAPAKARLCTHIPGAGPGVRGCEEVPSAVNVFLYWGAFAVLVILPIVVTVYLARRAQAGAHAGS